MIISRLVIAVSLALALTPTGAAFAQDNSNLTPEELKELFKRQRGLVIAPGTDQGAPVDGTAPTPGTVPATAPGTIVELEKEDQVNIQIRFDFDSAKLKDTEKPKLTALCEAMKTLEEVQLFKIIGHTDSSGTAEYNQKLSLARAEEVKRHMVDECGIPAERLEAVGVGEDFLFDDADPKADANRRVEFQAVS